MTPDVDASGLSYLILSAGRAGAQVADRWLAEIHTSAKPARSHHVAPASLSETWRAQLLDELDRARVVVRLMSAGPELIVLDCARVARDAGVIDAELRLHVTDADRKRVHCMQCGTDTVATAALGDPVRCAGCDRDLVLYHHVSRRRGAYFGYVANAETVAVPRA